MKIDFKKISLFIVTLFLLLFVSNSNVFAIWDSTLFTHTYEDTSLNVGNLYFDDIKYVDNSSTSTPNIGISGRVVNYSEDDYYYKMTLSLYDLNSNLIGSYSQYHLATGNNTSEFTHMADLKILSRYSSSGVYYFKVDVLISDKNSIDEPTYNINYSGSDYVIDAYNINIKVNKNNTFDITETITANFFKTKHGIFRTIPMKNEVIRLDGSKTKNRAELTNLLVNRNYKFSKFNGKYEIKIGDAHTTLTGKHDYKLKYTYNIGKDPLEYMDELYFNLIGQEWDTIINNITFTIEMPEAFDSTKLGFSSGKFGETENNKIIFNVEGNTIKGKYIGTLPAGHAITVRCELPEGYFVDAGFKINPLQYLTIIIPLLLTGCTFIIWYLFGRDEKVIETVEFYPPHGLNSLEVGYLYKGKAETKDVTSLLIYLANKGYLKISETKEKSLFSKAEFKITKLKDYDGINTNERYFMEGLFKGGKTEVTYSDLYNRFYLTKNLIISNINNASNNNQIFDKKASNKTGLLVIFIILIYLVITIPPVLKYSNADELMFAIFFPGGGLAAWLWSFIELIKSKFKLGSLIFHLIVMFWGVMFGGFPWYGIVLPCLQYDSIFLTGYSVGLVSIIIIIVFLCLLPKRTKYGTEMLGKIKGFKNFLNTVEKDKLEAMVLENPTYFYDILPYTYVLGISNTWIKKFEAISVSQPDWYDSPNSFDIFMFNSFINSTMSSAESVMASSPSSSSSSSSGGSSGGGFSGGGSGGGGGGSW